MPTITRVSSYALHQSMQNDYLQTNLNMVTLQKKISSGKNAQIFQDLAGKVERVGDFEATYRNVEQYMETNELVNSRIGTMISSVEEIINTVSDAQQLVTLARSATEPQYPIFNEDMKSKMATVASLLNVSTGGRHLFAGSKTDTRPVEDEPFVPKPITIGVPDANYYRGDDQTLTVRASQNLVLDYGVRADDTAFQYSFTAMYTAIEGFNDPNIGDTLLDDALDLFNQALNLLNGVKSRLEGDRVSINNATSLHENTSTYMKVLLGEDLATDVVTASTELAVNESILQASFQSFSILSNLKLSDYLR